MSHNCDAENVQRSYL